MTAKSMTAYAAMALGHSINLCAQGSSELAERLTAMTAVSGYEQAMADSLIDLLPGAQRDRAGNVVLVLGDGVPVRAAICAMDEPGYVVGGLHDDGYVTVRRIGSGIPAQFDQGHAGHRVTIWGERGPVPAVVSIPSTHLRRGRSGGADAPFTSDEMYLDLGAHTADEVRSLGVSLLDPIALEKQPTRYGTSLLSGPHVGRRSGCAALATAASNSSRVSGSVVIAFTVESGIGHRGLSTLLNRYGPFETTLFVTYPPLRGNQEGFGQLGQLGIDLKYAGWQVETVDLNDIDNLTGAIQEWIRGGN